MEYRKIPHSGLELSVIGIGSGSEDLKNATEAEIKDLFNAAADAGINLIDGCVSYAEVLPKYGAALKGRRDKFHLQMHLGADYTSGEYARNYDLMFSVNAAFDYDPSSSDDFNAEKDKGETVSSKERQELYRECVKSG
jgi:predicted aldo/keto reductase-like oxidoreductase